LGKAYVLAYGQGTVEAYSFQEGKYHTFYLKETFYTPDHPDNLLSIGRIDNNGGKIIFGKNKVVLYDSKNNIVVDGKLTSNRLYQLNVRMNFAARTDLSQLQIESSIIDIYLEQISR